MEANTNYLKNLYEKAQEAAGRLVVSYIGEHENDYNGKPYPYKVKFSVHMLDTTEVDKFSDSPDILRSWLGFELNIKVKSNKTDVERITARDIEKLVELADPDLTDKYRHVVLKNKYHYLIFQRVEAEDVTPLTCIAGDEKEVENTIRAYVEQGKILAYEIWSGAGEQKIVKNFKVEHNKQVNGIPDYGNTANYNTAFILDHAILTLKQAQRLVSIGNTESTYRYVTFGTGYRVVLRIVQSGEQPRTGILWEMRNPLD